MDKNKLQKECMGIVNQLFDLAEVPVEKRQAINDTADKYLQEQFLRLFDVSGRSELLKAFFEFLEFRNYLNCDPTKAEQIIKDHIESL